MKLGDMIKTLRTTQYERIEIRDCDGNEVLTCPASSAGIMPFINCEVTEWFPHGAPNKDATFTVYVSDGVIEPEIHLSDEQIEQLADWLKEYKE